MFLHAIPFLQSSFAVLGKPEHVRAVLDIGSGNGQAASWLLDTFLYAEVTCVDPWDDPEIESQCIRTLFRFGSRVSLRKGIPTAMLFGLAPGSFDVVYISHCRGAPEAMTALAMGFELLRVGGLLCIDDYGGFAGVRKALDCTRSCFEGRFESVYSGYQVHLKKLS